MALKNYIHKIFIILILCYIWPLGGVLYAIFSGLQKIRLGKYDFLVLIISLSFYLAFINSTKTATSDTIQYLNWYNSVDRSHPIDSFLFYKGSYSIVEPVFTIVSIIINYITWGNEQAYLGICTFIIYSLQFYAIYIVAVKYNVSKRYIICIIVMLAFANPLFIQSIHALRQMMATSLLMLAIAYRVINGKNNWYLILASFLTHMSVIAYIPIIVLNAPYKALTFKRVISMSAMVVGLIMISENIGSFLGSMDADLLSATGEKIISSRKHNEMDLTLRGFYMYNIPFFIIGFISLINSHRKCTSINIYYYIYFITFFIVVLNPISTEISIRYAFYIFSFFPYLFIAFYIFNRNHCAIVIPMFALILTIIFFWLLSHDNNYAGITFLLFRFLPFFS